MIPKEIIETIRHVEIITQRQVNTVFAGEYHSVFKGRGIEFSEVRPYTEGDDIRSIDWNVTARMGEPYVKVFVEERELTLMLLIDASASGRFGSTGLLKSDIVTRLSAVLAFSAIKNNDKVGMIIFTDRVEKCIPPKKGKNHVLRLIRELLCFEPQGSGTRIADALKFCVDVQKKHAVVFCISDFLDTGYEQPMRLCAQRHDLIAVPIRDPLECMLPRSGLVRFSDAETGQGRVVDAGNTAFRRRYKAHMQRQWDEMHRFFASSGIDAVSVRTDQDYVHPLIRFFRRRERMLSAGK